MEAILKKMLTVKQVNEEYNIPINLVYKLVNDYIIPSYRYVNKTRYVKREDVEKWIEKKQIKEEILLRCKNF